MKYLQTWYLVTAINELSSDLVFGGFVDEKDPKVTNFSSDPISCSPTSSRRHTLHKTYIFPEESPKNIGKKIVPHLIRVLNWLRKREIHKEYRL